MLPPGLRSHPASPMFEGSTGLKLNMLNLVMLARYASAA